MKSSTRSSSLQETPQMTISQLFKRCIFQHKVRFCDTKSSKTPVITKHGEQIQAAAMTEYNIKKVTCEESYVWLRSRRLCETKLILLLARFKAVELEHSALQQFSRAIKSRAYKSPQFSKASWRLHNGEAPKASQHICRTQKRQQRS